MGGHAAHIKAELGECDGRTPSQQQLALRPIESQDFSNHKGDPGAIRQLPEVNADLVWCVEPCDQARHHSRIQGLTAAVDQRDQALGSTVGVHGPSTQHKGMAVATASEHQVAAHVVPLSV